MRQSVKIRINKEIPSITIKEYASGFDVVETTTILELKNDIKSTISFPFEVVKEIFYNGDKELKDNDVIPLKNGLSYFITIK